MSLSDFTFSSELRAPSSGPPPPVGELLARLAPDYLEDLTGGDGSNLSDCPTGSRHAPPTGASRRGEDGHLAQP